MSLVVGIGLIVVVNAIVLGGVAYNRSSQPESALRLSERELHLPGYGHGQEENSGITLTLNWRVLPPEPRDAKKYAWSYAYNAVSPYWLDHSKILALGFEKPADPGLPVKPSRANRPLSRDVLLVLELDGPAYQAALARAVKFSEPASTQGKKPAIDVLKREQEDASRLFVVDAGLDASALRARYPDRSRYAIVHGQVRPNWTMEEDSATSTWYISGVSANSLNVPLEWRHVFDGAAAVRPDGRPSVRYAVDVKFGQRLEPWIDRAMRVAPSAAP